MGRCHYDWFAAVAASIALSVGCTSQTTAPGGGAPIAGRGWTTTSPAAAAAQTSSGRGSAATQPQDSFPGSAAQSVTERGEAALGKTTPSQSASAMEQFTHAVTQNPVSQAVSGAMGRSATWVRTRTAKMSRPRVETATDTISLAHESPPPGADLYVAMARLNEQGGKVEQAVSLYEKALEKDRDHLAAKLGLAHLLDREGRFELAIMQYREAAKGHPNDPTVHNDFGLCYARNGDMDDAIAELTKAVTLRPHSKLYRNNLATVLVETGRNDEALEHLAAAHGQAVAHYNLGILLHQRGHDGLAAEQFATAVQVNPKLEPAKTWLARLGGQATPDVRPPVASEGLATGPLASPTGPQAVAPLQASPNRPQLGPVVGNQGPLGMPPAAGMANPAERPARPVYPESWRSHATDANPVHLPALRGPEQAVLPPTPDDIQRYPTSGLPSGPRPY